MINSMKNQLPRYFKPIFWSYQFSKLDPERDQKVIIIQTINYGNLRQWKWIKDYYGIKAIRNVLGKIPATEVRYPALKLASLLFKVYSFNYAPRGFKS